MPEDFLWLGKNYEWWEDTVLLIITLAALGLLIYARRYVWAVLKEVPKKLYIIVTLLVIVQYLAENEIGFNTFSGTIVEELCEAVIYIIAFTYLWRFKLDDFNTRFINTRFNNNWLVIDLLPSLNRGDSYS
ncbi:hypothetical protein [Psychrobacter piechaudii]|uniref:hypothetical protein n=1 Tax=Psychrobacter piechaudii TaxID=1945521 RepID=UPI00117B4E81|nr:hypothetical protein [Psychrobacter piechaudii]